jgi:uncharacterized protein YeaO (DUF488 family)
LGGAGVTVAVKLAASSTELVTRSPAAILRALAEAAPGLEEVARMTIRTKSVYSPIDHKNDGLRILATRVRGRGLRATRYDVWMANLAPSEALLNAIRKELITWGEFSRRYRKELQEGGSIDKRNRNIKNHGQKFTLRLLQKLGRSMNLTLMCHCDEDQQQCHRHLLRHVLSSKI